jgi:DNA repair protein RadC
MEALNESIDLNAVAEITLAYRPKVRPSQRPKVDCSRQDMHM